MNTGLLFVILFYIYALNFLFTVLFNELLGTSGLATLPGGAQVPVIRGDPADGRS